MKKNAAKILKKNNLTLAALFAQQTPTKAITKNDAILIVNI